MVMHMENDSGSSVKNIRKLDRHPTTRLPHDRYWKVMKLTESICDFTWPFVNGTAFPLKGIIHQTACWTKED